VSDPERWRKRGEKLRAIAADVVDSNLRARLIRIADGYDGLAARAERTGRQRRPAPNDGRGESEGSFGFGEPACFDGQGLEPNEQNTQQSPLLGRSRAPHREQS